jgi:phosphatidylglycerol:prolipoprotein diacylglycerol transferase
MYPILARYGAIFIYSYTVVMALGIVAGIVVVWYLSRERPAPHWFDALLVVLAAAVTGGRAGYVGGHWAYFQGHPVEIWQFSQGGLSYPAALLAGIAGLLIWTAITRQSFYRYAALLAPAFLLASLFGWGACWLEGCAYGKETVLGWMSAALPDEYGVVAVRYRVQLIGALLTGGAFLLLVWLRSRVNDAQLFLLALALVSLIHLLVGTMRADPSPILGPWRLDGWLDAAVVTVCLLLLQYERLNSRRLKDVS